MLKYGAIDLPIRNRRARDSSSFFFQEIKVLVLLKLVEVTLLQNHLLQPLFAVPFCRHSFSVDLCLVRFFLSNLVFCYIFVICNAFCPLFFFIRSDLYFILENYSKTKYWPILTYFFSYILS